MNCHAFVPAHCMTACASQRVDEDDGEPQVPVAETAPSPSETDKIHQFSNAVALGVAAMKSSSFWTFSADSAEAPSNPYMKRPLPYVVGTAEFHDDDKCGLDYDDGEMADDGSDDR